MLVLDLPTHPVQLGRLIRAQALASLIDTWAMSRRIKVCRLAANTRAETTRSPVGVGLWNSAVAAGKTCFDAASDPSLRILLPCVRPHETLAQAQNPHVLNGLIR